MIPFPEKKYSVIYADPPWNYAAGGKTRNVERHYRTMKPEDIYSLPDSRLRLGETKPKIAFLVLGSGKLDTRKRGNLSSGHKRQTEARVSVSP